MYIKQLNQIKKEDIVLVGGKGLALGEMLKAGFPVPDGFVITTNAYKEFHKQELPLLFIEEINKAFESLKSDRVAVRSSAIAEDSLTASWAGQLDSYLNVTKEHLVENIKKCWNSIYSTRAKSYVEQQEISKDKQLVAVVVQKMINSEAAGVIFTQNPVTNNANEIVIESCYGLGELLVQGSVTPDNFIVSKDSLTIRDYLPHDQKQMLTHKEGKQKYSDIPDKQRKQPSISKEQVKSLVEFSKEIENYFGMPQDIEWEIENEKIYILQSRPITTA